jgi:hypothetical protein
MMAETGKEVSRNRLRSDLRWAIRNPGLDKSKKKKEAHQRSQIFQTSYSCFESRLRAVFTYPAFYSNISLSSHGNPFPNVPRYFDRAMTLRGFFWNRLDFPMVE